MTNLKNLDIAIQNQPKNKNFFDETYTKESILKIEQSIFELFFYMDNNEGNNDQSLASSLQEIASSISSVILKFPHVSKLMDAGGEERESFFNTFKYLKTENNGDEDNLRDSFKKAFTKEYSQINPELLKDPSFMNSIKDLQMAIARKHDKVIDIKTLFNEVRSSKVLMEYLGDVTTRSEY